MKSCSGVLSTGLIFQQDEDPEPTDQSWRGAARRNGPNWPKIGLPSSWRHIQKDLRLQRLPWRSGGAFKASVHPSNQSGDQHPKLHLHTPRRDTHTHVYTPIHTGRQKPITVIRTIEQRLWMLYSHYRMLYVELWGKKSEFIPFWIKVLTWQKSTVDTVEMHSDPRTSHLMLPTHWPQSWRWLCPDKTMKLLDY